MNRNGKTRAISQAPGARRRSKRNFRADALSAFRALGHGVDPETAREHVHAFYRSSGNAWTRSLA